jgi:hypothetical protein
MTALEDAVCYGCRLRFALEALKRSAGRWWCVDCWPKVAK